MRHAPGLRAVVLLSALSLAGCGATVDEVPDPRLRRLASVPEGGELTGLWLTESGDLFFNVQHPFNDGSPAPVGVLAGVNMFELPRRFESVAVVPGPGERDTVRTALGRYQVLMRGGERDGTGRPAEGLGRVLDTSGLPLTPPDRPDFNAFVTLDAAYTQGLLFTAWETRPGAMSRLSIRRGDGQWQVDAAMNLDFDVVQGIWGPCFGSLSPWGTPLASEELYFDDTARWYPPKPLSADNDVARMAAALGHYPNPYRYGYIVEITQPKSLKPVPVKRFALGRYSHENAVVMPDYRTVYLSDDGVGTVLFKFVADLEGDLSAGTLYAARLKQDADERDAARTGFDIEWIALAKGNDSTIARWIAEYDGAATDESRAGYIDQAAIDAWARGEAADERVAFLESRKAAKARGASAEFNKSEGLALHFASVAEGRSPFLYLAVSRIGKTMSDDTGDIRLEANGCGVIYRLQLDERFNARRMEPVLAGRPGALPGTCDDEGIAGPDNLLVMPDGRLLIGEDSRAHKHNMLWVFDPEAK